MERSELFNLMDELQLYGMKAAFDEIMATAVKRQHEPQRVIADLLTAEINEKQARSIKYQLSIAKLPLAKDLDGFQFDGTPINETLVRDLAGGGFLDQQRNAVLIGGTGTGKTHLAIAIARSCIRSGSRGRFYNVVDLVNRLEAETRNARQGRLADHLARMDFVIFDELGYLPFAQAGGQLLFHLISRLYERTSIIVTTNRKCGAPHLRFNAVNIVMRTLSTRARLFRYFERSSRRIKERLVREAMSLSLARKRPDRSFGAVTALSASSLIEGSARVYISVVCIFA